MQAMMLAGAAISAVSSIKRGNAEAEMANRDASEANQKAKAEIAIGLNQARDQRRESELIQSRAIALSAAGGGTSTDPSTTNIIIGLEGEGEYNALSSMFDAKMRSKDLRDYGAMRRYEGKQAKKVGYINAFSTVLSGAGSYAKNNMKLDSSGKDLGNKMPWRV